MAIITILLYIISLLILYKVIENAVKNGINRSIIGQFLETKYGVKVRKPTFLEEDLDKD
ncbi:hypothetical protein [Bacillus sp. Marseille-P3661]|uniref:hypothetical protein n=1 Tax=Bacillus sp. Marseille-P3661 TaxID=1936234 RepID=UPI002155A401|nr:hypothetical protein [Bacillus sp. Marseille-P3661]